MRERRNASFYALCASLQFAILSSVSGLQAWWYSIVAPTVRSIAVDSCKQSRGFEGVSEYLICT